MDHVDQDRAATRLPSPRVGAVVITFGVGFIEHRAADHANERPENSGLHDLHCLVQDRAVASMMADQQRNTGALGRSSEPQPFGIRVRERLLDQHWHARRDAFQALLDVKHIGCGDDHAVRAILREQLGERRMERHAGVFRNFSALGDLLDVPASDETGADNGDADFAHDCSDDGECRRPRRSRCRTVSLPAFR